MDVIALEDAPDALVPFEQIAGADFGCVDFGHDWDAMQKGGILPEWTIPAAGVSTFDPYARGVLASRTRWRRCGERTRDYHGRPVAPFGDEVARLLIVGLAPGLHGANRTGRPFTGDHAGLLLYRTLHRFGFASHPESVSAEDGLRLIGCRITNAVKCWPPANKPTPAEVATCNAYLRSELADLEPGSIILALGAIAHESVLRAVDVPTKGPSVRARRPSRLAGRPDAAR